MKLIASDYDGTLNRNRTVSQEDQTAIKRWRSSGNLFGLVSGRGYEGACHEMQYYDITVDFLICNNGSVIYDGSGNCLSLLTGDPGILKPLVTLIMEYNGQRAAISGGKDRRCVILDPQRDQGPREHWISFSELDTLPFSFTQVDTNAGEQSAQLTAEINRRFGSQVQAHQNGHNVDITPLGATKPNGIHRLIRQMQIKKENTLVIGDHLNDLSMIEEFNGFAVSTAHPLVIEKASRVFESIQHLVQVYL